MDKPCEWCKDGLNRHQYECSACDGTGVEPPSMNYQDFQAPNLDDVTMDDARNWVRIFEALTTYARKSLAAKENRFDGFVDDALKIEKKMDELYRQLPEQIRW